MQAFGGPVPSMRTQHKSLRNLVLQARPLLAQAPLTFLFRVHLTVTWEVTRSKKVLRTKAKTPSLSRRLNAQTGWTDVFSQGRGARMAEGPATLVPRFPHHTRPG